MCSQYFFISAAFGSLTQYLLTIDIGKPLCDLFFKRLFLYLNFNVLSHTSQY